MSFILGLVLFVGVIGFMDARLPWPVAGTANKRQS
jgi:hypothetical protein